MHLIFSTCVKVEKILIILLFGPTYEGPVWRGQNTGSSYHRGGITFSFNNFLGYWIIVQYYNTTQIFSFPHILKRQRNNQKFAVWIDLMVVKYSICLLCRSLYFYTPSKNEPGLWKQQCFVNVLILK